MEGRRSVSVSKAEMWGCIVESCALLSFPLFWAGDYYFDTYTGGERVVSARAEQLEFDRKWK